MILVQNLLRPLSGNKHRIYGLWILMGSLFLGGCGSVRPQLSSSSKASTLEAAQKNPPRPINPPEKSIKISRNLNPKKIALLLPLNLEGNREKGSSGDPLGIEANGVVWDLYQGLLLGLDSIGRLNIENGHQGLDIQVFDTGEDTLGLRKILSNGSLDDANLIIGPVYPSQIKQIRTYSLKKNKFIVSPISPQSLNIFNNPNLVMMNSPLEAYSRKTADFIHKHYPDGNIIILDNSPNDLAFYSPILNQFAFPPKVVHITSNQINSQTIPLSGDLPNILIIPSLDKAFWAKLLVFLSTNSSQNNITVFAHPNFLRINSADPDLLSTLHLHFVSNYFLDNTDPQVIQVQKLYRGRYMINPSEYALLGYDIGTYFGTALSSSEKLEISMTRLNWKGIHNDINLKKEYPVGFWNSSIKMLEFIGGSLQNTNDR